jgi:hypothetical protein
LNSKGQDFTEVQLSVKNVTESKKAKKLGTLPLEEDESPQMSIKKVNESTSHHVTEAEAAKEETAEDIASIR